MTHSSLFNENWFRVRTLMPRLAPDVVVARHIYRMRPNYILRRKSTRRWHCMSASTFELLAQFDGKHTVEQVWKNLLEAQGDCAPDQSDVIGLLSQLHDADMLIVDAQLDARLLVDRKQQMQERDRLQRFWNPLHIRIALFDPNSLLERLERLLPKRCFKPLLMCMLMLLTLAGITLAPRWAELTQHLNDNSVFDPASIVLLAILYPLMKLLHELAHGLVVKRFGAEVREFGIAMLVLFPNPYVDASAASIFVSKYQRMLVGAAGIAVEVCMAAIAVLVWASSTGLVRDTALAVMILGSVSTLLFNGNPLLKFDGYYILSDWLEIPNLASRSRRFLLGTMARLLGLGASVIPDTADTREKYWLIAYGVFSTLYRLMLMGLIAWMLSGKYFFFGVLIALYIGFSMLIMPAWKLLCYAGNQTPEARGRLTAFVGVASLLIAGVSVAMPGSSAISTDGIVWLPEQSVLRLEQPCQVVNVSIVPGANVKAGQHLFDCMEDTLLAEKRVMQAELQKIDAQRAGLMTENPVEYTRLVNQRAAIEVQYELARRRLGSMSVTAPVSGRFLVDGSTDLIGRFIKENTIAGYVVPPGTRTIRLALTQLQAAYLTEDIKEAQIFFIDENIQKQVLVTSISRKTPKATRTASLTALTTLGGGEHRATITDSRTVLEQPVFDLELRWPEELGMQLIGSRLRVRIEHQPASLPRLISDHVRNLLSQRLAT